MNCARNQALLKTSLGNRVRSANQYRALLQLWRNADAELEPLVSDVKRRLGETGDVATREN